MKHHKGISEESDLVLFNEYGKQHTLCPSYRELVFIAFMIVLYYSNYVRWVFWTLAVLFVIGSIFYIFDSIHPYSRILKKELKRRGY